MACIAPKTSTKDKLYARTVEYLRDCGYSQRSIAGAMGLYPTQVKRIAERHGIKLKNGDEGVGNYKSVWAFDRWWTYGEIGRLIGQPRRMVERRHKRGETPEQLFGEDSSVWQLGISIRDWRQIVELAKATNATTASQVYEVPVGAIEDALAGRWELID